MKAYFPIITDEIKKIPFYVTGIGMKDNQNPIYRKEGYTEFQIALCLKGQGIFSTGEKNYTICEGMGFFFCPNIPHEYLAKVEPWVVKWLIFRGSQVRPILDLLKINNWEVFTIQDMLKFNGLFDRIDFMLAQDEITAAVECSALLYTLLVELGKSINLKSTDAILTNRKRLEPVLLYMDRMYDKDLSLNELAHIINVTPHFLCRLFKQCYQTSPFKYLIRLRIQKSKHLFFQYPEILVKEVAYKVGFNDVSYFCSVFKEYEGMTPAEFRSVK